jgi:hypothetical protein
LCLLLALFALAGRVLAQTDLFAAETVVADEGSETRNTALSELLAEVLVRVSGNSGIAGQPAARELLAAAPSLVQQYRYRSAERDGQLVRYLWARFDQPMVERMMRERSLPVWSQRPRVLLWAATEQAGQRELLNLESHPEARAQALAQAQQRGMPLQLPLMDLEDQSALTPADVWADYQAAIRQASARYPHDLVLTARLRAQPGGKWSGAWSLIDRDGVQGFQVPAQQLGDALAFAIDQTQNLLAARYAPMPGAGGGSGTLVRFSEVYDLAAYGSLVAILEGLEPVAAIALRQVQDDSFTFELTLRGSEQDLARALAGSGRLVAEPAPLRSLSVQGGAAGVPAAQPEADLYYRVLN